MRALLFNGELKFVSLHSLPPRKTGEALIKVLMAGICRTDLEIIAGYQDFRGVPGHEFVGIVQDAVTQNLIGKRVVGDINIGCRACEFCRQGLKEHCVDRKAIGIHGKDGCFADYVTLPEENLHILPDNMSTDRALFVEPLAAVYNIMLAVPVKPTDTILIIGDGKLGILSAQVLKLLGTDVTVVGKHRKKLSVLEWMGIETRLFVRADDFSIVFSSARGREEILTGRKYDIVVDASGSRGGLEMACRLVKPRGHLVLKSTIHGGVQCDLTFAVLNEVRIIGYRCGPFQPAIRAIHRELVEVRPLMSGRFPLEEWQAAFELARSSDALKVMLEINQP